MKNYMSMDYRTDSSWKPIASSASRSRDTIVRKIAELRKAHPTREYKAVQFKGPRGGVTYGIESRAKVA